jgi:hypothetical protein
VPCRRQFLEGVTWAALGVTVPRGIALAALTDPDARAIQKVIRDQMAAFARDDADAAFSFATPAARKRFGNAGRFLESVKSAYQPVYRPGDVVFLAIERTNASVIQPVQIGMPDGKVYIAYYEMQRQDNKVWKINGCELSLTNSVST